MKKFDEWNLDKQKIEKLNYDNYFVNPRDIYFTKMGINIGFEENGKKDFLRPVLVLKKVGNLFFTVALTSKGKDDNPFYYKFKTANFNDENKKHKNSSYCILSQVRIMDKKRFADKIGYIKNSEFKIIKEKLREFLL